MTTILLGDEWIAAEVYAHARAALKHHRNRAAEKAKSLSEYLARD